MHEDQCRGYYFEQLVRDLMKKTGYIDVHSEFIRGRGADHQIDSIGVLDFPAPFVNPLRLIAEAKWYIGGKIGLPHLRAFVGLLKDISENYFVPGDIRGDRYASAYVGVRYTDCGAFFSPSVFHSSAQYYAWAHNVYLVPLGTNRFYLPVINRALKLVKKIDISIVNKEDVFNIASRDMVEDIKFRNAVEKITSYVAMLDGIYPIFLISDKSLPLKDIADQPDEHAAMKTHRVEKDDHVDFEFVFGGVEFTFSLPNVIALKLIESIEKTKKGKPFSHMTLLARINGTRRIFTINLYTDLQYWRWDLERQSRKG